MAIRLRGVGVRTQVLVALALVLGLGMAAAYVVTTDVTRGVLYAEARDKARQLASLAAGRLEDTAPDDEAMGEALAQLRALVAPDELYLLSAGFDVLSDGPVTVRSFHERIPRPELAAALRRELTDLTVRPSGEGVRGGVGHLVVLAPLRYEPGEVEALDPAQVPSVACLVVPLGSVEARLGAVEGLFALFMLGILALALIGGYVLIGRLVLGPVGELVRLIERAERAGLSDVGQALGAGARGTGELAQLHDAFHALTRQLEEERRHIQRQLSELELANREIETARDQLVVTEKLATVGQLAAGVAHEIGNPIAILQGYLELLEDPQLDDKGRLDAVAVMQGSLERIGTIIRDLLDFARPEREAEPFCDACEVARVAAKLVRPQKKFRELTLDTDIPATPVWASAHAGRLEQVLLNLLLNAADASPPGGTVDLSVYIDEANGKVLLTVEDEGEGLDRGEMVKVFDPFFTTKDPGEGTGLGLAISHSIAHSYGGTIAVRSKKGEGAAFSIVLPLSDAGKTGELPANG